MTHDEISQNYLPSIWADVTKYVVWKDATGTYRCYVVPLRAGVGSGTLVYEGRDPAKAFKAPSGVAFTQLHEE